MWELWYTLQHSLGLTKQNRSNFREKLTNPVSEWEIAGVKGVNRATAEWYSLELPPSFSSDKPMSPSEFDNKKIAGTIIGIYCRYRHRVALPNLHNKFLIF